MNFLKNIFNKKEEPIHSYADFWDWFQKNERTFYHVVRTMVGSRIEKDFFEKLSPKLAELKPGFYYLTGMLKDGTAELVLTADGIIPNIVFVEELVAAAPPIKGWLFTALKPATDIKNLAINMAGYRFVSENMHFYANDHADFPDEIDITIVHDDLNEHNSEDITRGVLIFLDNFLGELNFVTTIDTVNVLGKNDAVKELVPIEKLNDFLIWREKEFIEKYEGIRHESENDTYSSLEAQLKNGNMLIAIVNSTLLNWDSKASHPWILSIGIKYDGENNNGMPDNDTYQLLDKIEDEVLLELKDFDGYLSIGRQTADSEREIYFAFKDFKKASKVMYKIQSKYAGEIDISYDIYKDKYWRSFNRFMVN